jgi:hypothetical protein
LDIAKNTLNIRQNRWSNISIWKCSILNKQCVDGQIENCHEVFYNIHVMNVECEWAVGNIPYLLSVTSFCGTKSRVEGPATTAGEDQSKINMADRR